MKRYSVTLLCCLLFWVSRGLAQNPVPALVSPQPITAPMPEYPKALADTAQAGSVTLVVQVKADGTVGDARIQTSTNDNFSAAALTVISQWRFTPGTRDGVASAMTVTIPFKFLSPFEQRLNTAFHRKIFQEITEPVLTTKEYGKKLKIKTQASLARPSSLLNLSKREDRRVEISFVVAPDGTTLNPVIVGQPNKALVMPVLTVILESVYEAPVKDGRGVYVATKRIVTFDQPKSRGGDDDLHSWWRERASRPVQFGTRANSLR